MDTQSNLDKALFRPIRVGDLELKNRIVMASLTRIRADAADGNPTDIHTEYYAARGDAGLILTECSQISYEGTSFPGSAGIYSDAQVQGWKKVTDAVHEKGSKIFLQIWHGGRSCHPDHNNGTTAISATTVPLSSLAYTKNGKVAFPDSKEATDEDLEKIIQDFRKGAENAKAAGFDGVELHGAHGYLID